MGAPAMRVGTAKRHLGRAAAAASIVCSLTFLSRVSLADEPLAPEADTNPNIRPRPTAQPNLILIGAAVTAGWYGIALGTSYLWPDSDGAGSLRIPVAGPYMALAKTGCGSGEPDCDTVALVFRTIVTVLSAVGQTGGVLAMGEGLFLQTGSGSVHRGDGGPSTPVTSARELPKPRVSVAPVTVGKSGFGLSLSGSF
jgi:hypothetical protein